MQLCGSWTVVVSALLLSIAAGAPAVRHSADSATTTTNPISNQYIVQLKAAANAQQHLAWVHELHTRSVEKRQLDGLAPLAGIEKNLEIGPDYKVYTGQFDAATLTLIKANSDVLLVEQDQTVQIAKLPRDSATHLAARQSAPGQQSNPTWNLRVVGQRPPASQPYYFYPNDASGTFAYVLDTGLQTNHAEFEGRASNGYNAVGGQFVDDNGHGTAVGGIIASKTYGVAKRANLIAVKIFGSSGSGSTSGILDGISWAVNDVKNKGRQGRSVMNLSAGGAFSQTMNNAVRAAYDQGVPVVVAAGNSNTDVKNQSPASEPTAITVGSMDENYARTSSSNYGAGIDLFAPGRNILTTWNNGGTNTLSGSTLSSAHVAGVALIFQFSGSYQLPPASLRDQMVSAASRNALSSVPADTPNLLVYNNSGR